MEFEFTRSSWFLQCIMGSQDPSPTCCKDGWSHFYRIAQDSIVMFLRTYQSCWVIAFSLQKKTWYFIPLAQLAVMNGNNPQIRDRLRCSATGDVARERR